MVTRWGMGSLGLVALDADDEQPFLGYDLSRSYDYGEETANRIDADVQDLLTERFEYGRQLLAQHRGQLDSVMQHLLREEKVNRDALARILGPRPEPKPGEVIVAPRVEEEAATIAA